MRTYLGIVRRVGLCLVLAAGTAQAAAIDFTKSADWAGAAGGASFVSPTTFAGVTVTVSSNGGSLTFNGGADIHPNCLGVTGLACQGDGLGITDDEVTVGGVSGGEVMTVTFSKPVRFNHLGFLDLYSDCAVGNICDDENSPETVMWRYGADPGVNSHTELVNINSTDPGWFKTGLLLTGYYTSISFFATNPPAASNTDFALALIDFDPQEESNVPEPGSLLLLGSGLVGVATVVRRRRQ